jgi:hypothetical protein
MLSERIALRQIAVFFVAALLALLNGCKGEPNQAEVQRKLVRATVTSTPRPEKGRRPPPTPPKKEVKATPTARPTASQNKAAATASSPTAAGKTPTPKPTMLFVTSHNFDKIVPMEAKDYRIEGRGLSGCRVFLRRYGAETELVPTTRDETAMEFRGLALTFLERGSYDLIIRDTAGRELTLPQAAKVP